MGSWYTSRRRNARYRCACRGGRGRTLSEPGFPPRFFEREDEAPDAAFYREPRFVVHIDAETIAALTTFYQGFLPAGCRVLDLMSSWVSHLPDTDFARVAGLGMNECELAANPRLSDARVHDLNVRPRLPYADDSFDRVVVAVSVQYLIRPVDVFRDVHRVLAPGGRVAVAMSHRCFPTKAILAFRAMTADDRVGLVGVYLHRAGFEDIASEDRSPPGADPLWLVTGNRTRTDGA